MAHQRRHGGDGGVVRPESGKTVARDAPVGEVLDWLRAFAHGVVECGVTRLAVDGVHQIDGNNEELETADAGATWLGHGSS